MCINGIWFCVFVRITFFEFYNRNCICANECDWFSYFRNNHFVLKGSTAILLCVFIGITTCLLTIQPLIQSFAFMFERYGIKINFGVARGFGSAASVMGAGISFLSLDNIK